MLKLTDCQAVFHRLHLAFSFSSSNLKGLCSLVSPLRCIRPSTASLVRDCSALLCNIWAQPKCPEDAFQEQICCQRKKRKAEEGRSPQPMCLWVLSGKTLPATQTPHPHGSHMSSLCPHITTWNISFRKAETTQQKEAFPWRLLLSSQEQKQITARKARLVIPSSSPSSLWPSAPQLTIRNSSTGFLNFLKAFFFDSQTKIAALSSPAFHFYCLNYRMLLQCDTFTQTLLWAVSII